MPKVIQGDARQRILKAAQERLWNNGFKKTTIDEIASDAGVGKGTVYLYFDSKEDIALTIMAAFKEEMLEVQESLVRDPAKSPLEKLREMILLPCARSHEAIAQHPTAMEMVTVIRPHFQIRMRPYFEQEIALIAQVLEEGNRSGVFAVSDTISAARSVKYMVAGFWPPYPCVADPVQRSEEIVKVIDLAVQGLRKSG